MAADCKPSSRWRGPTVQEGEARVPWVETDSAETFFGVLILLNAIVLGIDIEISLQNSGDSGPVLLWIQVTFLVIFVVELLLRLLAAGPRNFLCSLAGIFDCAIILASVFEYVMMLIPGDSGSDGGGAGGPLAAVSVMRVFRLLRIARIVRILHIFPELKKLVTGLAASLQAVFWVFCLLCVVMYVGALICAMELGHQEEDSDDELREFFGSISSSFYTHFMIVTLEGYPAIAAAAGAQSPIWYIYIVCFILFSNMVLMNLVTGIVCESVVNNAKDDELASHVFEAESQKFNEVLAELIQDLGFKSDKEITLADFKEIIRSVDVRETLNLMDICLEIDDEDLFQIIDEDGSGSLSFAELFQGLERLRGSKETLHSLLVQCDLVRHSHRVKLQLQESEDNMSAYATSLCEKLGSKLHSNLQELRTAVDQAASVASALPVASPQEELFDLQDEPWAVEQRFRLRDNEKDIISKRADLIDPDIADSVTTAVLLLNEGKIVNDSGCVVVYSKSTGSSFMLYHETAQADAYDILAEAGAELQACAERRMDATAYEEPPEQVWHSLRCPPCLQQVLGNAQASALQTRAVLTQLGSELEASRARVQQLGSQLQRSSSGVQTDPLPSLDVIPQGASRESGVCWLEDDGSKGRDLVTSTPLPRSVCSAEPSPSADGVSMERRRLLENTTKGLSITDVAEERPKDLLGIRRRLLQRYHDYAQMSPEATLPALAATAVSSGSEDEPSASRTRTSTRKRATSRGRSCELATTRRLQRKFAVS